jgi:hypothetical protein
MAMIEDILNALAGRGYADGSTWMQAAQKEADGPPAPSYEPGLSSRKNWRAAMNVTPDTMSPAQYARELMMAAQNANRPQIGAAIPSTQFQQANLGTVEQPQAPAPSGMIGIRALAPYLRDIPHNAPQLGANTVVASNEFRPFNGRY